MRSNSIRRWNTSENWYQPLNVVFDGVRFVVSYLVKLKMELEELKRIVKFHGPFAVAKAARVVPPTVCNWIHGRQKPIPIRLKWISEKLDAPPSWEMMAPMSKEEVAARLASIGGPRVASKLLDVHENTIGQWALGRWSPSPRHLVTLRRLAPKYTVEDTSPMGQDELLRILRVVGMENVCMATGCSALVPRDWLRGKASPSLKYRARLRKAFRERCV